MNLSKPLPKSSVVILFILVITGSFCLGYRIGLGRCMVWDNNFHYDLLPVAVKATQGDPAAKAFMDALMKGRLLLPDRETTGHMCLRRHIELADSIAKGIDYKPSDYKLPAQQVAQPDRGR